MEHRITHLKTQVRKMWYYSVVVEAEYIVSKTTPKKISIGFQSPLSISIK